MFDRNLATNDIDGAYSRSRHYYLDRQIRPVQGEQLL